MMYKCFECGNIFEDGEEAIFREPHGEETKCCPVCHGGYTIAKPCRLCGEYEGVHGCFCDECRHELSEKAFAICKKSFSGEEWECVSEMIEEGVIFNV